MPSRPDHRRWSDPALDASAAAAVETTMYRALAVLRVVVLLNAFAVGLLTWEDMVRPVAAAVVLGAITTWTAVVIWAYDDRRRRRLRLYATDLAVSCAAILATAWAKDPGDLVSGATLPSFWVMGVVLAWGIRWGWVGGLAASSVVSAADLSIRTEITQSNIGNIFLLMIGGPVLGYCTERLKELAVARDRAERAAAAATERARLARAVHDGVLQVLALVQRRGRELGGDAAELGRLAGAQEVALRSLVQREAAATLRRTDPGSAVDLAHSLAALEALVSPRVSVALPGQPVLCPAEVADELLAVVRACLDNVTVHVGEDASAWVLLEDLGDRLVVTVRDDGPGIPPGRLEQAADEGRLGVSESVKGRTRDLGGAATMLSGPGQGTEWELSVPRSRPAH